MRSRIQSLIESMLEEEPIEEEKLKSNCKYLTKASYDDINVERSLINLCGYPLCSKRINNVPRKRYQISLANHKVYDLERRKQFCSDVCYKASCFLRDQLSEEPFSIRANQVDSFPEINFYHGESGLKGDIVELSPDLNNDLEELTKSLQKAKLGSSRSKSKIQVSAPYIREDQLNEFKDSLKSMKIVENIVKERNPFARVPKSESKT